MIAFAWCRLSVCAGLLLAVSVSPSAQAEGMIPETSVVIVNEADGEAAIKITNSDPHVALLHVTLQNIPEDPESLLFVTPQLTRVAAGKQQLIRFVLMKKSPLKVQRLKRVIFEGIPPARSKEGAQIGLGIRQNLPVIIHPRGLARNPAPWTGLTWSIRDGSLQVRNETPYVVRLAQAVHLLPAQTALTLPRSYVLPGDHLVVPLPSGAGAASTAVRLHPATVYGYAVEAYDAPLSAAVP